MVRVYRRRQWKLLDSPAQWQCQWDERASMDNWRIERRADLGDGLLAVG